MPPQQKDSHVECVITEELDNSSTKSRTSLRWTLTEKEKKEKTHITPTTSDSSNGLQFFLDGFLVPGDSGIDSKVKPAWVVDELVEKGQRVGREYIFGHVLANLLVFQCLFAYPDSKDPLLATGNSETVDTARRRYLSTCRRVMQWYNGDLWKDSVATRELSTVRATHARVRKSIESASPERAKKSFECNPTEVRLKDPIWKRVRQIFDNQGENLIRPPISEGKQRLYLNQSEMIMTMFSFIGPFLFAPRSLGMGDLTDDKLEALVHVWAVIGYQLGIEDRFNKCIEGLESMRKTWRLILKHIFIPALAYVDPTWEHMNTCIVKGLKTALGQNPSLEASVLMLSEVTEQDERVIKQVQAMQSWRDYAQSWLYYIIFEIAMRYSCFRWATSILLHRKISKLCKEYARRPNLGVSTKEYRIH